MNVIDTIRARRSIRRYAQRPLPPAQLLDLIELATWAPSAHNRQPWRFAVITERPVKHRLATAMGHKLRTDLSADKVPVDVIDNDVNRSYARITQAPALILLCLTMAEMDSYPDPQRQRNEYLMAVQSCAMAAQNLLLAAHAQGLGACWMCAPLFCPDLVQKTLGLASDWMPQALITVGYPAQTRTKTRKPLSEMVQFVEK